MSTQNTRNNKDFFFMESRWYIPVYMYPPRPPDFYLCVIHNNLKKKKPKWNGCKRNHWCRCHEHRWRRQWWWCVSISYIKSILWQNYCFLWLVLWWCLERHINLAVIRYNPKFFCFLCIHKKKYQRSPKYVNSVPKHLTVTTYSLSWCV